MQYNGRFLEVSSEQRKMKISRSRAYLQRKIFQESAKAPVFPASIQLIFLPSIKIAQLVSDIKQHHMTNTYHNDYGCWLFSVQSIDNGSFIHSRAFARESVCLYTRHAVTNSWKRRRGGIHCVMWAVMLPVVWFTKSSQWHKYRTCVLLVRVKYFWDTLMKQVVGWYI